MASQVKESVRVWQSIQQRREQELRGEEEESATDDIISAADAKKIAMNFAKVLKTCRSQQERMRSCNSAEDCSKASVDLTMCMGPILCPVQQKNLTKTLAEEDDAKIEAALETLTECVVLQTSQRTLAKKQHPTIFKGQ